MFLYIYMSNDNLVQQRFHFIDGFRAVACLLAILHHSVSAHVGRYLIGHGMPVLGDFYWNFTGSGVDFFFVLSGLLLLRPYLRDGRKLKLLVYFKKRFLRLWPTYGVALIFGALVIWYINAYPTWYNEKGIHVSFSLEETLHELPMLNLDGIYYNLAWWSVQVEAVFYIFVPFILFVFPRRAIANDVKLFVVLASSVLVTVLIQLFFDRYIPSIYSLHKILLNVGRFLDYPVCFVMGMVLATRDLYRWHGYVLMVAGTVFFFLHSFYLPLVHVGYGLFYGGMLVLVFYSPRVKKVMASPWLVWVGERSYSLFLVHLSVFYLIDNLTARITTERDIVYALITRGVGIPLSFLAAIALFHFVERKFSRGLITDRMIWPWQYDRIRHDRPTAASAGPIQDAVVL